MTFTLAYVATELLSDTSLSPKTRQSYEGVLLPLLKEHGAKPIQNIHRQEIAQYLQSITHVSYRTHNKHQTIINRLFSFGVERGYTQSNPVNHLKRKKPDGNLGEHGSDELIRYLKESELTALYKLIRHNPRLTALVTVLHESGARVSEVLALNLKDINLTERQFQVIGKGNKKRWCYFGDRSDSALQHYINGNREHPNEALFTERLVFRRDVRQLSYSSAYRDWREALKDHPTLSTARLHDLRHTFATERANVLPLEVLRALLGHQNIQTTLIYQKITSHVAKEAAHNALKTLQGF